MDIVSIGKSLLAALIVGALGWWGAVITLSWSDQSGAFIVGALSIIILILTCFGIWWAASDKSTTAQGVAVFAFILLLIIGTMLGGARFSWFASWIWKDFGLGILMAFLAGAAVGVVHARATIIK